MEADKVTQEHAEKLHTAAKELEKSYRRFVDGPAKGALNNLKVLVAKGQKISDVLDEIEEDNDGEA